MQQQIVLFNTYSFLGVEMVGRKKREVTGMILNYFYSIGEALVALIAWLSRDWVILQLTVSAPPILFVIYYWQVQFWTWSGDWGFH